MSLENPQSQEPTEITPEQLQKKYYDILQTSVSPENITTFFDDALDEFVEIAESAKVAFQKKNPDATALQGADFEDQAFHEMGLEKLDETLEVVAQKMHTMNEIKKFIQIETTLSDTVFVPPQPGEYGIKRGSGEGMEQKKMLPRLIALLYILEHDLDLPLQEGEEDDDTDEYDVDEKNANEQITLLTNDTIFPNTTMLKATTQKNISIQEGSTLDSMMRKQPYFKVCIASLERIIYLCNEEGNASFIFDTQAIQENNISTKQLDETDKGLFKEMFIQNPTLGRRIIQSKFWRENMLQALTETFNQTKKTKLETVLKPMQSKSDFESKKQYPEKKEGWESESVIAKKFDFDRHTIRKVAQFYQKEYPDGIEIIEGFSVRYSREIQNKIEGYFSQYPKKEDNYVTTSNIAKGVGKDIESINNYIKKQKELIQTNHPEWIKIIRTVDDKRVVCIYCHPDLEKSIIEHFESIPKFKEGWKNIPMLADELGNSYHTIKKYIEITFRKEHPDWFEDQEMSNGHVSPCVHPNIWMSTICHFKELNKIPYAIDGWETLTSLYTQGVSSIPTMQKFLDKQGYRSMYPKRFKLMKTRGNVVAEHVSPEIVDAIKVAFNLKKSSD